MRVILACPALLCLAAVADARDYSVDDMLALESYGKVSIAPDGRLAVVERSGRYDGAARFSYGWVTRRMTSRVMTLDLQRPRRLEPAFGQERDAGYWTGSFSPSGRLMTVFRLRNDRLSLGILDVARRQVRWLPGAPDLPISTPSPLWLGDRSIAFARFRSERLPYILEIGGIVQSVMPQRWRRAASGLDAVDLASTRFAGTVPRERRDVVVADVASGRERTVATGEVFDLALSTGGSRLAVTELAEAISPDPGRAITERYLGRRMRLRLIDVDTGVVVEPCDACDVARGSMRFSKDGDLAFIARLQGRPWTSARLRVVVHGGLDVQTVGGEGTAETEWVGDRLIARSSDGEWSEMDLAGNAAGRTLGRYGYVGGSAKDVWLADGGGLWRFDARMAATRVAKPGYATADLDFEDPASVGSDRLRRPEQPVLRYRGQTADRAVFGFQGGAPISIDLPRDARLLAASGFARAAIYLVSDDRGVGRLWVGRPDAAPTLVDRISARLADVEPPKAVAVSRMIGTARAVDWLFLPRGRSPFPLVVFPYQGGMQNERLPVQARPGWFGPAFKAQLLTSAGYAVLIPSIPEGPAGHPQDTLVADLDAAVDAAVATGQVDPTRIAVFGHSYGGVNALTIASRSSRYRAYVAANALNDYAGAYGSVPPAQRTSFVGGPPLDMLNWFENGQGRMEMPPWADPYRYVRASSLFQADRIRAPVLLIASDLDYVPLEQGEHMFVALARLGRDATLLRVYGEGHVFQGPGNIRREYETVLRFLREKMPPKAAGTASAISSSSASSSRGSHTGRRPGSPFPASWIRGPARVQGRLGPGGPSR